ncbi:MAG: CHAT domain-containing protein [Nakamurella sp.]
MVDPDVHAIHLLGAAGRRSVRATTDESGAESLGPDERSRIWRLQLVQVSQTLGDLWTARGLDALLNNRARPEGTIGELTDFGDHLGAVVLGADAGVILTAVGRWAGAVTGYSDLTFSAAADELVAVLETMRPSLGRQLDGAEGRELIRSVRMLADRRADHGWGRRLDDLQNFLATRVPRPSSVVPPQSGRRRPDLGSVLARLRSRLARSWSARVAPLPFDRLVGSSRWTREYLALDRAVDPRLEPINPRRAPPQRRARPSGPLRRGAVLNTGVAQGADVTVGATGPLEPDTLYWLWIQLGARQPDAIPADGTPIRTALLRAGDEFAVVLFPDEEIGLRTGSSATMRRESDGRFVILPSPTSVPGARGDRLYFGFTTPVQSGSYRIRCALMVRGTIIHVEQVTVPVGTGRGRLAAVTSYRLFTDFSDATSLFRLRPPALSIYANSGEATHDFSVYLAGTTDGAGPAGEQLRLDSFQLTAMVDSARAALGWVAWGTRNAYRNGDRPIHAFRDGRFPPQPDAPTLGRQLIELALVGARLWTEFVAAMNPDLDFADRLAAGLRHGGAVQLAPKVAATQTVPLQLLYDFAVDTGADENSLRLCSESQRWIADPDPVGATMACLTEACPDQTDWRAVCVAGFWGFRHAISVCPSNSDQCKVGPDPIVPRAARPVAMTGVTTDERIRPFWSDHRAALESCFTVSDPVTTADGMMTELAASTASVVYLLTHVAVNARDVPAIAFDLLGGDRVDGTMITRRIRLCGGRPIVFLNGCESAALQPSRVLGLVTDFQRVGASGAVGTEITTFVSLAMRFAEAFAQEFTAADATLAEAIRLSRWRMLSLGNPLGLAYSAFGLHDLRLAPAPAG